MSLQKVPFKAILPWLGAVAGVCGMHLLLSDFGYETLFEQIKNVGIDFVPIFLSFTSLFFFLALGWWVLLPQTFPRLFAISLVANAWNSIGPVSKSLGEPSRVYLISGEIGERAAMRTMFLFNLAQSMGTGMAFGISALLAPLFFSLTSAALILCGVTCIITLGGNFLLYRWMRMQRNRQIRKRKVRWRKTKHWLDWTSHQVKKFAKSHPRRFAWAVFFCALGRVLEGVAFYFSFRALKAPISILESIALDMGRGIADNAFFFIPYQLGTREASLLFITDSVIHKGSEVALTASILFRIAEISWIGIGLLVGLWMFRARGRKA